jgi:Tfp pilus assembly protein FimT
VIVRAIGRSLIARPIRLGGALLTVVALSAVVWYLASPLFVRTYRNEALPSLAPSLASAVVTSSGQVPTQPSAAAARVLRSGELGYVDAIHNGKGPVRIVDVGGQRFVRFEDVMLTNAPDVHVYLSRETGGRWDEGTSLYLGALKATNGSFNYELPTASDLASYQSVVVWCRAFRVLITWADLSAV